LGRVSFFLGLGIVSRVDLWNNSQAWVKADREIRDPGKSRIPHRKIRWGILSQ